MRKLIITSCLMIILYNRVYANQYAVAIAKTGSIYLIETETNKTDTIYNWKKSTVDKWNQPRLYSVSIKDQIVTVIIYQTYQRGLKLKRDVSLITEFKYNFVSKELIFCRQLILDDKLKVKVNTILHKTNCIPSVTLTTVKEFTDIDDFQKSELTNGFYFLECFGLCMVPEAELDSFYERYNYMRYQNLLIEPTYKAPHKLAYWGVETFNIKQDKSSILVDFLLQERMFYFSRRKPISYIYEINLVTKAQKVLLTNGIRPSYSPNGKDVLYEKVYHNRGFFRLKTKGYFIWNRETNTETHLGKFVDAMFVKESE